MGQVGLKLLMDNGNVFKCWDDRLDAIYHAELGASAAILRAGYNLDCLLQRCVAELLCMCASYAPLKQLQVLSCSACADASAFRVQLCTLLCNPSTSCTAA